MTKSSLESMLFRLDSSTNQTGKLLPPLEIHRDGQVSKACQRSKDFYLSCLQNGVSIVPLDKFLNIDENDPPATKLQTIRARQLDAKIQDPIKIIEILCEKLSLKSDFFDEELENAFEATLEVSLPNNETKSIMGRGGSVHAARANASQNMINFLRNEGTLGIVGDELDDIIDESSEFTPIEMIIKFTGKRNLSPCYSFEQIRNDYFVCILKIVFREDLMKFSMGFSNRKLEAKRKAAKSMIQLIKNDLKIYYGQCKLLEGIDSSESYHSSYIIPSIPNAVPCSNENSGCNDNDSGGNGSSPKKLNTDFISLLKIFIDKNGGSSDFNFIALDKSDDFNFQCTVTVKNSSGKVLHEASGKGSNKKEAKKSACQQVLELLTAPSSPEKVKDDEIQIDEPITPDESLELEVEPTPSPLKPTKTCDPLQPRRISFAEEPTIIEIPNREMLKREQAEYKRLKPNCDEYDSMPLTDEVDQSDATKMTETLSQPPPPSPLLRLPKENGLPSISMINQFCQLNKLEQPRYTFYETDNEFLCVVELPLENEMVEENEDSSGFLGNGRSKQIAKTFAANKMWLHLQTKYSAS